MICWTFIILDRLHGPFCWNNNSLSSSWQVHISSLLSHFFPMEKWKWNVPSDRQWQLNNEQGQVFSWLSEELESWCCSDSFHVSSQRSRLAIRMLWCYFLLNWLHEDPLRLQEMQSACKCGALQSVHVEKKKDCPSVKVFKVIKVLSTYWMTRWKRHRLNNTRKRS